MEQYAVGGISIMLVILGLVQWAKEVFSLAGNPVKILAMVLGVVFGISYQLTLLPVSTFVQLFTMAIFGLMMGLTASGIYGVVAKAQTPTVINSYGDLSLPQDTVIKDPSQE